MRPSRAGNSPRARPIVRSSRLRARRASRIAREALQANLEAVVVEAEALATAEPSDAGKTWEAIEKRWAALAPTAAGILDTLPLQERLESAREHVVRRRDEADVQRGEAQRQNVTRLEALCARMQDLANAESLDAKVARRALQTALSGHDGSTVAPRASLQDRYSALSWSARVSKSEFWTDAVRPPAYRPKLPKRCRDP